MASSTDGNGLSPWAYGDPETTGAAQASMAMEPAVTDYLHKLSTGQIAASGLRALDVPYDPNQSFAANALNPQRLQAAQNIAMGFSGGGLQFEAFHGTPAAPYSRFADEFMGSGEGAQAYSWGHYVAQRTGTAESYMPTEMQLTLDGKPWDYSGDMDDYHKNMALDWMKSSYGNVGDVVAGMHQEADMLEEDLNNPNLSQFGSMSDSDAKQRIGDLRHSASFLLDNQDKITATQQRGNLARVNVIPDHEDFMDWDLPFSKQEPGVQEKLRNVFGNKAGQGGFSNDYLPGESYYGTALDPLGKTMYDDLTSYHYDALQNMGSDFRGNIYRTAAQTASKELDAAGIPGMRFGDQGTRHLPATTLEYTGAEPMPSLVEAEYKHHSTVDNLHTSLDYYSSPLAGVHYKDAADFVDEHWNDFKQVPNPNKTYNYVVYDPNNIEITHWNDIPVTPVEGTPPGLPDVSGAKGP